MHEDMLSYNEPPMSLSSFGMEGHEAGASNLSASIYCVCVCVFAYTTVNNKLRKLCVCVCACIQPVPQ